MLSRARIVQDRTPNIITFQGTYNDQGHHVAFFDLIDNEEDPSPWVQRDCKYIKWILACDCVRLVIRPFDPLEENNGFQYPNPSEVEKTNLRRIVETFRSNGLDVMLAFVLPERLKYGYKFPTDKDNFYAKNGQALLKNQIKFTYNILSVLDGIPLCFVDYFGDFDPLDVYGRGIEDQQISWGFGLRNEFDRLVSFYAEAIGSVNNPIPNISKEFKFFTEYNFSRFAFQAYNESNKSFLEILSSIPTEDFLIEEAGTKSGDGKQYFKDLFKARNQICPHVPIGLWAWGAHTTSNSWEWSLNKDIWEMRPCWWEIQEGASGTMWDIEKGVVKAVRKQSNFLVFRPLPANSIITLRCECNCDNHVKDGEIYFGQWDRPISRNLAENEWWPKGVSFQNLETPNVEGLELWVSVDFNWVDPNLYTKVECLVGY